MKDSSKSQGYLGDGMKSLISPGVLSLNLNQKCSCVGISLTYVSWGANSIIWNSVLCPITEYLQPFQNTCGHLQAPSKYLQILSLHTIFQLNHSALTTFPIIPELNICLPPSLLSDVQIGLLGAALGEESNFNAGNSIVGVSLLLLWLNVLTILTIFLTKFETVKWKPLFDSV